MSEENKKEVKQENKPKEDVVTLPKSQLEQMMKRIEMLEEDKNFKTKAERIKENKAYLRKYIKGDKEYYVMDDVKNVRLIYTITPKGNKEEVLVCDLIVLDGKELKTIKEVNYLDFIKNAPKEWVLLTETMKKEKEVDLGEVDKIKVKDYTPTVDGVVDNVVKSEEINYIAKFSSGEEMKVKAEALNI